MFGMFCVCYVLLKEIFVFGMFHGLEVLHRLTLIITAVGIYSPRPHMFL